MWWLMNLVIAVGVGVLLRWATTIPTSDEALRQDREWEQWQRQRYWWDEEHDEYWEFCYHDELGQIDYWNVWIWRDCGAAWHLVQGGVPW